MITFLQESKFTKNSFLHVENSKKASHFRKDGGPITEISKLQTSNRQSGFNPSTETPLEMPTMNFGEEKQPPEDDDVLIAPSTL